MANIRDVAKEAGCSITTVSKVLSGDSEFRVKEETRQKVMNAVAKLQYKIPARHQNRHKIACILSLTTEKYADPFFTTILGAMETECENHNMSIVATRSYNELMNPSLLQEILDGGLDGIVLMERVPEDLLFQLHKHIPNIIYIDNDESDYHFDSVGFDHNLANRQAMKHIIEHGYKRIALISGSSPNEPLDDSVRMSVYRHYLRKHNLEFDEALVKDCEWDLNLCAKQAIELMRLPEPPDAIYAGSDSLAQAMLGALYGIGVSCPRDVGIMSFNNLDLCARTIPPLSTVAVPTEEIGITTIRRLHEMIKGKGGMRKKILLPTEIIRRESLTYQD